MSSLQPSSLQVQSANCYLKTIANSKVFKSIHTYAMMMNSHGGVSSHDRMEEVVMQLNVSPSTHISKKLDNQMKFLTQELKSSPGVLRLIKQCVIRRAQRIDSPPSDLLLQLFFSNTIMLQEEHEKYIYLLDLLNKKFRNIKTLLTNKFGLTSDLLQVCLPMFPCLIVIKAFIQISLSSMTCIRQNVRNIEELRIGASSGLEGLTNDDHCRAFFSGHSLKQIEECFVKGTDVYLSFPKIRHLSYPITLLKFSGFFKMFLHFYPNCDVDWIPQMGKITVSTFDAILSQTIDLNPAHKLRHCELRYEDLRFPDVDKVLIKWSRLESLSLAFNQQSDSINHGIAKARLGAILSGCEKLSKFQMAMTSGSCSKCYQTIFSCVQEHGHRLLGLAIVDDCQVFTHKELVTFINYCPNLVTLNLHCKPTSKYSKDAKVNTLSNLIFLKLIFLHCHTMTKSIISALFICDLLKASPNITKFNTPLDDYFITELSKFKFQKSKIDTMTVYFYVNECRPLMKPLLNLVKRMHLKELVVDTLGEQPLNSMMAQLMGPVEHPHLLMRALIKNTQLHVRCCEINFNFQCNGGIDTV